MLQSVRKVMSFLGKANFCTKGHSQLCHLCHVIQSDMLQCLSFSHTIIFTSSFLSFPLYINWNGWLNYNKVLFHCNFHFLIWSLLLMLHPLIGPFIFRNLELPLSVSSAWSGSLSRAHTALQQLQAVAVMLSRMAFHLSGKVVALHLDKNYC